MPRIVWITGAKGFIGKHLAHHLAQNNHHVYGVGHGIWPQDESNCWGMSGWLNSKIDIENLEKLRSRSGTPLCIFHLAGGSSVGASFLSPYDDFVRTVDSTAQLLEWMRLYAPEAKLVAVSSAAVYGDGYEVPISEGFITNPFSPYGHHKLMMEEICRSYAQNYGIRSIIPRLFSVYGRQLRKQLLWDLCNKISKNSNIVDMSGSGEELRDWIHIEDATRALLLLSDYASKEVPIFNVGSGNSVSVRNIATTVIKCWPSECEVVFSGVSRQGDPNNLVGSPSKLQDLGFEISKTIENGISDYVSWYLSESNLK